MAKILNAYLKRHIKVALLIAMYAMIFAVIFKLHNLPVDAVVYAYVLSLFVTILLFGYGFTKFYKNHKHLMNLSNQITLSIAELPETGDLIVADYQSLIRVLFEALHKLETDSDYARTEMVDYYTLWAHQIKTPISAMSLLVESEPSERNLMMKSELFKIQQYVEMVLQYLRLESETSDIRIETHDLEAMLKASIRKYRTIFIEKNIRLNFEVEPMRVLTDEKWFSFAFEQILSNALKYTHVGEITISVVPSGGVLTKQPLKLMIRDTGIGIQDEDLPRVFERGFTGYNGRMDKKSTGIGLYLCKKALNKLSHALTIQSEVGVGTTVYIDLSRSETVIE
jgi:signal transduction histidine kinase